MPQDIRPSGYFPQGTFIIPTTQIERQRKLAEQIRQGITHGPVQHWSQGAARLVNALGSVLQEGRANEMEQQRRSALAEAMRGGDPDAMIRSGEPDLQQVGQFLYQQRQQQAQAEHQAAQDAENQARWEANFKQNADQFAATQARLNQPNFTEGTLDQKEMYGPDFLGMGQNGPIFKPSSVARSPWKTVLVQDEYGAQTPVQINEDTGEQRATTPTGAQTNTSAAPPPAAGPAPPPGSAAAPPTIQRQRLPKMAENEGKSFRFYKRGRNFNEILNDPEVETGLASGIQDVIGAIPGVANYARSEPRQKGNTASVGFLNALGYSDSGAQINRDEYWKHYAIYIPSRGDSRANLDLKRRARAEALQALRASTGKGVLALDKEEAAYAEARAAIAAGKDPKAVGDRLEQMGFDRGNF